MVLLAVAAPAFAQTRVTARWDRNTDSLTAGYRVSYGTSPGNHQWSFDAGNQTEATLSLSSGGVYYVAIRAYNASYELGPPSSEETVDLREAAAPAPWATVSATLQNGSTAVVHWSTVNAVSATINGQAVTLNGTTSVSVSQPTTTFTIVATNAAGATVTEHAWVTMTSPPPSTAPPTLPPVPPPAPVPAPWATVSAALQDGSTAVVHWSTVNAVSATINGQSVALNGSATVPLSQARTTFTIVATNAAGATVTEQAWATMTTPPPAPPPPAPPPTPAPPPGPVPAPWATVSATLQNGNTAALNWSTVNAVSATINGQSVALSGTTSVPVSPGTTTFTIVATNAAGATVTEQAWVTAVSTQGTPNAPQGLGYSIGGSSVYMWWGAPGSGEAPTGYVIEVGTAPGRSDLGTIDVGRADRYTAAVASGTRYVRVRAVNARGAGAPSNEVVIQR